SPRIAALVCPTPPDHGRDRQRENFEVKPHRPPPDVFTIEVYDFLEVVYVAATLHLPQAGHARLRSESHQMPLLVHAEVGLEEWPGPHERHVAGQDVPQLRQLVQAPAPELRPEPRHARVVTDLEEARIARVVQTRQPRLVNLRPVAHGAKRRTPKPTRCCRNNTGPGESSLIATAMTSMTGAATSNPIADPITCTSRFTTSCHPLRLGAVSSTSGTPRRHTTFGCTPASSTVRGNERSWQPPASAASTMPWNTPSSRWPHTTTTRAPDAARSTGKSATWPRAPGASARSVSTKPIGRYSLPAANAGLAIALRHSRPDPTNRVSSASRPGARTHPFTRSTASRSPTSPAHTSPTVSAYWTSTAPSPWVHSGVHSGNAAASAHPKNNRPTSRRRSPGPYVPVTSRPTSSATANCQPLR